MTHVIGLLLLALTASAGESTYKIGETFIAFAKKDGLLVNAGCLVAGCEALKRVKSARDSELPEGSLEGGKNPSAVRCKLLLEGTVVYGKDKNGNEQSFCFFASDQSFVSN